MSYFEVNFDGLAGPTHNFSGLSFGNLASTQNASLESNPQLAALQGLEKMQILLDLGCYQGIIPPQQRPNITLLKQCGFHGSEQAILQAAKKQDPALFAAAHSSSSMWTANAATVSPSIDCKDGKLHITPANLQSQFHRAMEVSETYQQLQSIFANPHYFTVHPPLPSHESFADEGAANHIRLCPEHGKPAINIFVYGRDEEHDSASANLHYPARQTLRAQQAIARSHGLNPKTTLFIKQSAKAINHGVFHNDVISVGNENVLFYHQDAFENQTQVVSQIKALWAATYPDEKLYLIESKESDLSLDEAVASYLFNSQVVTIPNHYKKEHCWEYKQNQRTKNHKEMVLIAPIECQLSHKVKNYIEQLIKQGSPITQVIYVDLRESMKNGGGPACLRLRVTMREEELKLLPPHFMLNKKSIQRYY